MKRYEDTKHILLPAFPRSCKKFLCWGASRWQPPTKATQVAGLRWTLPTDVPDYLLSKIIMEWCFKNIHFITDWNGIIWSTGILVRKKDFEAWYWKLSLFQMYLNIPFVTLISWSKIILSYKWNFRSDFERFMLLLVHWTDYVDLRRFADAAVVGVKQGNVYVDICRECTVLVHNPSTCEVISFKDEIEEKKSKLVKLQNVMSKSKIELSIIFLNVQYLCITQ